MFNLKRKPQIYDCVFELEYFINLKLKISCGFSTSGFKPMVWLHYKNKNFIGFDRDEWTYLMSYKEYILATLHQYEFLDFLNLINKDDKRDIEYSFQYKNSICYMILQQDNYKIKIDPDTWKSLTQIGIFLTAFLNWNSILRKQILYFYYDYYIPTCALLNKTNVQLNDIKGINERDVEIDLIRLCYEFGRKMPNKIKTDVKIYRLLLRMDNK